MIIGDSIRKVLLKYLKPSNAYKAELIPVMIRVKELKIREERHFLKEEGVAKIAMKFYVETDKNLIKSFNQIPYEHI